MGKFLVALIVIASVAGGAGMYYLQVYGFYDTVYLAGENDTAGGAEMRLTLLATDTPEPILVDDFEGIDADSSPLRFRACFTTPQSLAMLTETYVTHPGAEPLTGPKWFECYDAVSIGADLETGVATAFLAEFNIKYGIDRVIAIYDDGRAYVWHQINRCGEKVFNGQPAPDDCPSPPERSE